MSLENNGLNLRILISTHKHNNPVWKCDITMISLHVERNNSFLGVSHLELRVCVCVRVGVRDKQDQV